jgi:hypothetical protein
LAASLLDFLAPTGVIDIGLEILYPPADKQEACLYQNYGELLE